MTEEQRYPKDLGMICDCGDERRAAAEALMAEVIRRLSLGGPEITPIEVTPANFLTQVCWSLAWNLHPSVHLSHVYCDQWFAVKASDHAGDDAVIIQCDQVEHGLAAIWKHYADKQRLAIEEDE